MLCCTDVYCIGGGGGTHVAGLIAFIVHARPHCAYRVHVVGECDGWSTHMFVDGDFSFLTDTIRSKTQFCQEFSCFTNFYRNFDFFPLLFMLPLNVSILKIALVGIQCDTIFKKKNKPKDMINLYALFHCVDRISDTNFNFNLYMYR